MKKISNILVPYDGSNCSKHAFKLALDMSEKHDAKLILITCIEKINFNVLETKQSGDNPDTFHESHVRRISGSSPKKSQPMLRIGRCTRRESRGMPCAKVQAF